MVGMMAAISREKIASGINSVKYGSAGDVASKLEKLRRLRGELSAADSVLLVEFISPLLDMLSDHFSPVRKFVIQMIGDIGVKHLELLPEIIPALIGILRDDTPAVARQAISSGIDIFRHSLVKVAIQGLHSSEFNESLESSWAYVLKLRDEIYSMAFKVESDGRRLAALKFVESVVLLYTPDPNGSMEPPADQSLEGNFEEFNISWLRGGHPILHVGDLSVEASRSLGLLLDQLRFPSLKSHSHLMIIVLIKSLSSVARKRPAFYGRILPVLLGLDPSGSACKGMHLAGVHHALKNAFDACMNCSHPGAAPWRDRLLSAIAEIKVGKPRDAKEGLGDDEQRIWRDDLQVAQVVEEKPSTTLGAEHGNAGRKRAGVLDMTDLAEDESSGKRARSTPEPLEGSGRHISGEMDRVASNAPAPEPDVSEPVQQLVTMFGALAAQGGKAAASLEILISSISADLLADVVMANMRNFPQNCPLPEGDETPQSMTVRAESVPHLKRLARLLREGLSESKPSAGKEAEVVESHHFVSSNLDQTQEEEANLTLAESNVPYDGSRNTSQPAMLSMDEYVSTEDIPSAMETSHIASTSEVNDNEPAEDAIPGLALSTQSDGFHGNVAVYSKDSADLDEGNQEKITDSGGTSKNVAQFSHTERSETEELSPRGAGTDATSTNSSASTLYAQVLLPKISAPVVHLADGEKDQLQELAFEHIVDAYKQVAVAGGSQARFSILAHSGMEFPSELDPWKLLKTHIMSDYVNNEGHELTLRVLYKLYGEAEEDRDFFSSTTATSVYETFLLQVAETLRDSFPASDKSLGRLLGEVPYLPKSLFDMLERLCSPGSGDNNDKELHGGDRVTQGLSTAWSLILLRPPIRDACLKICLQSAVHHLEEVRMKAIRLVANKLYPLSCISTRIEEFAKEMLLSVAHGDEIASANEADRTPAELTKDENPSGETQVATFATKDVSSNPLQSTESESIARSTVAEVQRCMSLYFALCTKKHSLLREIFVVYKGTSKAAKQAIHGQIPLLVRTVGSSRDLLDILSDPPTGGEGLVTQVVNTLTDGIVPSPGLVSAIKRLYSTRLKDIDVLIPILPFLPKDEVLLLFPHLVNIPLDKFHVVLSRVLQGLNHSPPVLTPAEALIAIHGIDPDRDGIPLKKVTDACNACFEQRQIFTQQVLAKVLNQLVEQIPLPLLFMRTVLQAIGAFPSLVDFIMEILSRLVSKQIWKYPKLWVGFMKCALLTKPQSFGVLLQLPAAQLENALHRTAALKAPLVAHSSQPHIRSTLPRSTLVVLGLVPDAQTSTQMPSTQTQTEETCTQTEETQAQTQETQIQTGETETQTGENETQTGLSEAHSGETQVQTAENQASTVETGTSQKEEELDQSKESSTTS